MKETGIKNFLKENIKKLNHETMLSKMFFLSIKKIFPQNVLDIDYKENDRIRIEIEFFPDISFFGDLKSFKQNSSSEEYYKSIGERFSQERIDNNEDYFAKGLYESKEVSIEDFNSLIEEDLEIKKLKKRESGNFDNGFNDYLKAIMKRK